MLCFDSCLFLHLLYSCMVSLHSNVMICLDLRAKDFHYLSTWVINPYYANIHGALYQEGWNIAKDACHPGYSIFSLPPSGRRYSSVKARMPRLKYSYFPLSIQAPKPIIIFLPTSTTMYSYSATFDITLLHFDIY